jgi:hypothetical protein
LSVPPPGEAVADEQRQPEPDDQLWKQVLEVEDVAHFGHANPE